jgi:5-methylcytosine-specific restriction protein B
MEAKDDKRTVTIQFHPSYSSYEGFVRGYRPSSDVGKFALADGPFLRLCERADKDPDQGYVLIIDEINRGNLSHVFGELMMLVESDKRGRNHTVTPLYRRVDEDKLYVPTNLYIIGTMNIADRSPALVDYALRRRFAYLTLEPQFASQMYREWLRNHGMAEELVSQTLA